MSVKNLTSILLQTALALCIILFFSTYGDSAHSFSRALNQAFQLLVNTVHGRDLRANFWEIPPLSLYYTIRLLLFSFLFSHIIGLSLAISQFNIRNRYIVRTLKFVTMLFEAIPEALYVILTIVVVLLVLKIGISLPVFTDEDPTALSTVIPAITLALPGAFYLQRILYAQLRDEQQSDYVRTAISKGASRRRVFYRHIVPNLFPMIIRQLPVMIAIILSSALFAEFFFEFQGALYIFSNFAVGWNYITGDPIGSVIKPAGIPPYQSGLVFLIGLILVIPWVSMRIISLLSTSRAENADYSKPVNPHPHKIHIPSLIIGVVLLATIIIVSLFPHILTAQHANLVNMDVVKLGNDYATPPSLMHPLGTDDFGRDLLAVALNGTFRTLIPTFIITLLVTIAAFSISIGSFVHRNSLISTIVRYIGESLSGIPTLFILFLALYQRNLDSPYQSIQFILWISIIEIGRASFSATQMMQSWRKFTFVEGAMSIGRSEFSILFTHLRSWLGYFLMDFIFIEFTRVLSISAQLAAFHIYMSEKTWYLPFYAPIRGIVASKPTWVSMLGDAASNGLYLIHPYILYAPILFLMLTVLGLSLLVKGVRG